MSHWKRNGLTYEAKLAVEVHSRNSRRGGVVTLSLDWLTYHLVRLTMGEAELKRMVDRTIENYKRS